MSGFVTKFASAAIAALMLIGPSAHAQDASQAPVMRLPEKRVELTAGFDLPNGDLGPQFDVTLGACIQNCLNLDRCEAVTYNSKARACFPKDGNYGAPTPFPVAMSGRLLTTPVESQDLARRRARDSVRFVTEYRLGNARTLAEQMSAVYPPTEDQDPGAASARAEAVGDTPTAIRMAGILVAQRDNAEDWVNLARLMLLPARDSNTPTPSTDSIISTAINGYLRAEDDQTAARALRWLAAGYEQSGEGPNALAALRMAAGYAPNDKGIATDLEHSEDRNGMRVTDTQVETETVTPRFCATMSRQLSAGVDYADFVRLPAQNMTVETQGSSLCVTGLTFGQDLEITLRAGLPSSDGEKLAKDVTLRSYVGDRKPAVRFAGRGYILPSGGDQRLSVLTINADKVDLSLRRISDRNLLRVMSEGMFATPLNSWQVDYFSEQMSNDVWTGTVETAKPGEDGGRNTEVTTALPISRDVPNLEPGIYILDASVAGQNTEDTGLATQWFVISDFGISSLSGNDGLAVVVRSLATTEAKAGAEVALISRANEVLARVTADQDGIARFAPGLTRGTGGAEPALLTVTQWEGTGDARKPVDMAFLSLTDPEFDLSDRGVEGQPPAPPIDVFTTTERGAYRVGETVNATILARDSTVKGLADLPLTAVFIRPDGVEQAQIPAVSAGGGGYTAAWTLPGTAPRGTWRIDIRAEANGEALSSSRILVEDFLPERIDFIPKIDGETESKTPLSASDTMNVSLAARWLFGAPAAELPVDGSLSLAPQTSVTGFENYRFGRYDGEYSSTADSIAGGTTDAEGNYATEVSLPDASILGELPVNATVTLNVREGAGRPVERSIARLIMPAKPIIGIRQNFEDSTVGEGTVANFDLIAVGPDLKPQAAKVGWVVNRVDTSYDWYLLDGQWQWEAVTRRTRIEGGEAELGDTPVRVGTTVDWGQYELVVETLGEEGARSSTSFYAGWGSASGETDTPDRLKVALDKPAYRAGDTAEVSVQAIADGTGIVSVLAGKVISLQMVALKEGDNKISLPVTDEWGAGVYVTVSALRPLEGIQPGDRMPARALGLAHAAVDPGTRALKASLEVPAEVRPRQDVPITLKVEGAVEGQTVYATVAAVDQGILNLTRFTPPDPSKHYFGKRRLGVGLHDLYGRLILPTGAPDGQMREGGDAELSGSDTPPPTEKLMSWFSGPVTIGPDGTAQLAIPVGDFNGEIRVMAVVWSEQGVGQADATILSRDPVVMTVTAPAFLAPGDQAEIGLRLTHASGPAGEVRVGLAQTGGKGTVDFTAPANAVTLKEKGEAKLSVPITAQDHTGMVNMQLTLTTPDGTPLTKDIALLVAMNEPDVQRQDRLVIAPGNSMPVPAALTDGMFPGASISLAVGNYGRLDVAGALASLERYPYGCTEQLTSVALPLLYLPRLSTIEGVDANNPNPDSVDTAISRILTRQGSSGSFGMWSPDSGDLWLDAYVTDFLSRARETGHQVPDRAFKMAIDNLSNRVNYATEPKSATADENAALAYAVSVLARERAVNIGDLRYYADTTPEAFQTPMAAANLGAALAAYGDQVRADKMFKQASDIIANAPAEERTWRNDYGTYLRDKEALLALSASAKSQAVNQTALTTDVAEQTAQKEAKGIGRSTQELVWAVLAAQSLSTDLPTISVDGASLTSPVSQLAAGAALANTGDEPVEVTFTATGQPVAAPSAGGKGYTIQRDYYTMEGQQLDLTTGVPLGTRMVTVVTVTPDSATGGRLMVTDPLPAGFEIDNPNLISAGDVSAIDWLKNTTSTDMAEFRADRFAASLGWGRDDSFQLAYIVRAVTPGTFRHPAASIEDMYRPEYRAWTDGGTIQIVP